MGWLRDKVILFGMNFYEGLDALRFMNRASYSELLYNASPNETNGRPEIQRGTFRNGTLPVNNNYARRARDGCPGPARKPEQR